MQIENNLETKCKYSQNKASKPIFLLFRWHDIEHLINQMGLCFKFKKNIEEDN